MPVIKPTQTEKYTVIPNDTLRDQSLSFEARGVLALMLSMPADWEMYKSWLVKQCGMTGKDKMTRILKELEDAKYLIRNKKRNDNGRFDSWEWFIYPEPVTENGSAGAGSPDNGKSAPTKERVLQSKDNTNMSSTDDHPPEPDIAQEVVDIYHQIITDHQPNWATCKTFDHQRKQLCRKALNTVKPRAKAKGMEPLEVLTNLLTAMACDPFYSGKPNPRNPEGFRCTIETNLRPKRLKDAIDSLAED
jgi:hypothetical protein